MRRNLSMILTTLLGSVIAVTAQAESRVAVHDFYGPQAERLRAQVVTLLAQQEGLKVLPRGEVEDLARALQVDSFSPEGRRQLAQQRGLSAWLEGVVQLSHRHARLTVIVYDGANHRRMGRFAFSARSVSKLRNEVRHTLWSKAKYAILDSLSPLPLGRAPIEEKLASSAPAVAAEAAPEGANETAPAAPDHEPDAPAQSPYMKPPRGNGVEAVRAAPTHSAYMKLSGATNDDGAGGLSRVDGSEEKRAGRRQIGDAMRLSLGFGSPRRTLSYSDPISSGLNDHQLGGSLLLDAALAYYPGQHVTKRWPSYLGLDLAAQGAFGSTSSDSFGTKYKSHYDAYRAGVRGRIPLRQHFVSVFTGYAIARTSFTPESKDAPLLTPAVDYRALRSGLGAELTLSQAMAVGIDAAWLSMLSAGELGTWFPRATASGLELALQATYALTGHLFARFSASYRRLVFDFHARPEDARAAGGATDNTLTMSAGAGVSL